jgi:hypothetical protein
LSRGQGKCFDEMLLKTLAHDIRVSSVSRSSTKRKP